MRRAIPLLLAIVALLMAESAWLGSVPNQKPTTLPTGAAWKPADDAVEEVNPRSIRPASGQTARPAEALSGLKAIEFRLKRDRPEPVESETDGIDSLYLDGAVAYAYHITPHTFYTAVRFTPAINCTVKSVKFRTFNPAIGPNDSVFVFDQNTSTQPGALLAAAPWSYVGNVWNTINLPGQGVYVAAGHDVWTCVKYTTAEDIACVTSDAGPMVAAREYISIDRITWWDNLSGLGLDRNWNQRAIVTTSLLVKDMATVSIDGMTSPVVTNRWLTLKATVKNVGTETRPVGVPVKARITGLPVPYNDADQATLTVLNSGQTEQITFAPNWRTPSLPDVCTLKVWTELTGDGNNANDTAQYVFEVSDWITYANWNSPVWYTADREERGSWFFPGDFDLNYPVSIESLKTAFYYTSGDPWDDSSYQFRIYAGDLSTVLYTSSTLEAVDGVNKLRVNPPVVVNSGSFAVVVIPVSGTGAPWSLADGAFKSRSLLKQSGVWYWWDSGELMNAAFVTRPTPANDIGCIKVNRPLYFTEPSIAINPSGTVRNYGTNPVTAAPCSCYVSDTLTDALVYTGYGTVTVAAGETATVTFSPQWTPPAGSNVYEAVLASFLSSDGNALNDSAWHIFAGFHVSDSLVAPTLTPGADVTVDGVINTAEWWDANRYDVSNVMGWNDNNYYYFPNNVWLYLKHDATRLYGAVDLTFITGNDSTEIGLYVDENNDHAWSADSSEGNYWLEHFPRVSPVDSVVYRALLPAGGSVRSRARGSISSTGLSSGHQQYEFSIPFGTAKCSLNLNPAGDTCGFWFYMMDDAYGQNRGWWKTTMPDNAGYVVPPANYGHLFLTGTTNPLPDVGVLKMVAPAGAIDSSAAVTPRATLKNFGTVPATFQTWFFIDSILGQHIYTSTFSTTLAPGETLLRTFATWAKPHAPRRYLTRCSTYCVGDNVPGNNFTDSAFTVTFVDVGVVNIASPVGALDTSAVIAPEAKLKNFGTTGTAFQTWFFIDSAGQRFYTDTYLATLPAGDTVSHTYATWDKPHPAGSYTTRCSTHVAGDANSGNNQADSVFTITSAPPAAPPDVAVTAVIVPVGPYDTTMAITPRATFTNNGPGSATFTAVFKMDSGASHYEFYSDDSVVTAMAPGPATIDFATWAKPHAAGTYNYLCSVYCAVDTHHVNDAARNSFIVTDQHIAPAGWTRMTDLLPGGKMKNIKDGGALAYGKEATDADDTGYVYAFKGNNRYEFYRYNTLSNVWVSRESIPAFNRVTKKKAVKKGASLVMATDGKLYATKGNNTLDWWQYDPLTRVWTEKADVPTGAKKCKEGVGSVAVNDGGVDYVYLLRGSGTYDFYRYNTATDAWDITLPAAPGGWKGKPYKNGSTIAYDGGDTIYCLKGSYNDFAAYSISGRTWDTRDTMPRIAPPGTKKKKVKDGSGTAYAGRVVYALKGGNTNEFWTYRCDSHRWYVGTELTAGAKRVKGGGALVMASDANALYAFRGNNTLEFWSYGPVYNYGYPFASNGEQKSIQGQSAPSGLHFALTISPNPFTTASAINYSLPKSGNVSLKLYDVGGRLVSTLVSGYQTAGLHSYSLLTTHHSLASGIYLLKFETDDYRTTSKLIIE